MSASNYRPEIDGLRAIAVLMVLLFHFEIGLSGGYIGVDIFFVISGFLITGIILRESEDSSFSLSNFWIRRIRRIMPALCVVVAATLAVSWFLLLPNDFASLGESCAYLAAFISNVFFWKEDGYFAAPSQTKPLLHCWSLAVEEQFYFVYPIFLAVLVARLRNARTRIAWALFITFAISLALCLYGTTNHPSASFFLLPTRAWELLVGGILACLVATNQRRTASLPTCQIVSFASLALVIGSAFSFDEKTQFPGIAALVPTLGTAGVIWAESFPDRFTHVGKMLGTKFLVGIGLISYSLYLWHWPVLVLYKYWDFDGFSGLEQIGLLAACFALSALSWRFVETPFRKRQWFGSNRGAVSFGAASIATIFALGLTIHYAQGIPQRLASETRQYADAKDDRKFIDDISLEQLEEGQLPAFGVVAKGIDLIVWGDSHAMAAFPAFIEAGNNRSASGVLAAYSSTPPTLGYNYPRSVLKNSAIQYGEEVMRFIRKHQIENVFLVGRWSVYDQHDPEGFRTGLRRTIATLRKERRNVWLVDEVPGFQFDIPRMLAWSTISSFDKADFLSKNPPNRPPSSDFISELAQQVGVQVVQPKRSMQESGFFKVESGGKSLYSDNNHLSVTGAKIVLVPLVQEKLMGLRLKNAMKPSASKTITRSHR